MTETFWIGNTVLYNYNENFDGFRNNITRWCGHALCSRIYRIKHGKTFYQSRSWRNVTGGVLSPCICSFCLWERFVFLIGGKTQGHLNIGYLHLFTTGSGMHESPGHLVTLTPLWSLSVTRKGLECSLGCSTFQNHNSGYLHLHKFQRK